MTWSNSLKLTYGVEPPCKSCDDRTGGCHDRCERYKDYKDQVAEVKRKKWQASEDERLLHPGVKRSKGNWGKRRRKG